MALIHLSYFSPTLTKNMQLYVALPEFSALPDEKLKTVWMLHGYTGDYTDWQRLTGMERYAIQRRIAVVMPDGANSFYADMACGPAYFTYLTKELPEYLRTGPDGEKIPQGRGGKGLKNYNITPKTGYVAGCRVVGENDDVMLIESGGVIIRVPAASVNIYKRDVQGVIVMRIEEGNQVVSVERVENEEAAE